MDNIKYFMWTSHIDESCDSIWGEGYLIQEDGTRSANRHEIEIPIKHLKGLLSEEDFKEIQELGRYFHFEQDVDTGEETITLADFPELTEEQKDRAKKRVNKWFDALKEE